MPDYFLLREGEKSGPYSLEELAGCAANGSLGPDELVWSEGFKGWVRADEVEEIFPPEQPAGILGGKQGEAFSGPLEAEVEGNSHGEKESAPGKEDAGFILAGLWERLAALLLDIFILVLLLQAAEILFVQPIYRINREGLLVAGAGNWLFVMEIAIFLATGWLCLAWPELSSWQATLGKAVLGLNVAGAKGQRITLFSSTLRFLVKGVSLLLPLVFIVAFFTSRRQALHDLAAGSLVLRGKRSITSKRKFWTGTIFLLLGMGSLSLIVAPQLTAVMTDVRIVAISPGLVLAALPLAFIFCGFYLVFVALRVSASG